MTGICFLTVLESGESKFKVAAPLILRQGCLPGLQIIAFSLCVEENLWALQNPSSYGDIALEVPPFWPHLNLITWQEPYL